MIRIPELLAKLLVCFQEANPKVIVKTPFSKKESHYIKLLTQKYKESNSDIWLGKLAKLYLKLLSDGDEKAYERSRRLVARSANITPYVRG